MAVMMMMMMMMAIIAVDEGGLVYRLPFDGDELKTVGFAPHMLTFSCCAWPELYHCQMPFCC